MANETEAKRQYLIIVAAGIILLAVAGYVVYTYTSTTATPASSVSGVSAGGKGKATAETQRYTNSLSQYNKTNAEVAEGSGKSYISTLSTVENQVPPASKPTPPPAVVPPAASLPPAQPQIVTAPPAYGSHAMTKEEGEQLKAMIANWSGSGIKLADKKDESAYASSLAPAAPLGAGATPGQGTAASSVIIVEPYAQTYAQLLTEINTDETSMVRAVVPDGMPYAGAQLFATGYKRLNNDVDMTFDAMVYQGRSYRINAKPLDMDTSRTALSGDVTHHYFARIVLPALANGIGATGQLFAAAGQNSVVTPQGGVVVTSPTSPSPRNIAGTLVGGFGQSAGQVISNEAAQIPIKTTVVKRGEMIGIQFVGPVTSADDLAKASLAQADSAVTRTADTSQQKQQPSSQVGTAQPASQTPTQRRLPGGVTFIAPGATYQSSAL